MRPPNIADLRVLGLSIEGWESLRTLARQQHREMARQPSVMPVVGRCVCGLYGYQPTPLACVTLWRLLDLALAARAVGNSVAVEGGKR